MTKYTITMADGTVLDNLLMNGNMYVSQTEITKDDLNLDALSEVVIKETEDDGTEHEDTFENMVCDGVVHWAEGWLFNLRTMTNGETTYAEMDARIAFLEMMGGYDE